MEYTGSIVTEITYPVAALTSKIWGICSLAVRITSWVTYTERNDLNTYSEKTMLYALQFGPVWMNQPERHKLTPQLCSQPEIKRRQFLTSDILWLYPCALVIYVQKVIWDICTLCGYMESDVDLQGPDVKFKTSQV